MVRIQLKGGIWKNSEDEVLKAAVMKYGLNNWSRVSSLLVRKTPKQCKSRWYEWLSPDVKKTEWTKDEDEKLLHLAKCFPTQWRTIAPVVGRTAQQCLERYEKLLDIAQGKVDGGADSNLPGSSNAVDDPRALRPGELDPNPHTKPARADAIDMDHDELEMLSQARARLANTVGKKAKRKARESQLNEARRLASLQKSRELKAAGIFKDPNKLNKDGKRKKHWKKGVDYANEIPFLHEVPKGFHDASGPDENPVSDIGTGRIALHDIEEKRRDVEEAKKRKEDERKMKKLKEDDLGKAMSIINKMNDPANSRRRQELDLPEPVLQDFELGLMAKIGEESANIESGGLVGSGSSGGQNLFMQWQNLSSNNASVSNSGISVTGKRSQNELDNEAENELKRRRMQTPLMAEENPQMHESDFSRTLPMSMRGKNPGGSGVGMTPGDNSMTANNLNAMTTPLSQLMHGTPGPGGDNNMDDTRSLSGVSKSQMSQSHRGASAAESAILQRQKLQPNRDSLNLATPGPLNSGVQSTPNLNMLTPQTVANASETGSQISQSELLSQMDPLEARQYLQNKAADRFKMMQKPSNVMEIVMPSGSKSQTGSNDDDDDDDTQNLDINGNVVNRGTYLSNQLAGIDTATYVEDAAEKEARLRRERAAEEERKKKLRSLVVQREDNIGVNLFSGGLGIRNSTVSNNNIGYRRLIGRLPLPRPFRVNDIPNELPRDPKLTNIDNNDDTRSSRFHSVVEINLLKEIRNQIIRDAYDFPDYLGTQTAQPPSQRPPDLNDELSLEELEQARQELYLERELLKNERSVNVVKESSMVQQKQQNNSTKVNGHGVNGTAINSNTSTTVPGPDIDDDSIETERHCPRYPQPTLVPFFEANNLLVNTGTDSGHYNRDFELGTQLRHLQNQFHVLQTSLRHDASICQKREKLLAKQSGGQQKLFLDSYNKLPTLEKEVIDRSHTVRLYQECLRKEEQIIIPNRIKRSSEETQREKDRNASLQAEYGKLEEVKRDLEKRLA